MALQTGCLRHDAYSRGNLNRCRFPSAILAEIPDLLDHSLWRELGPLDANVVLTPESGTRPVIFDPVDPTLFPRGEPLCPANFNQTLARMVFRLNQRSRTILSY